MIVKATWMFAVDTSDLDPKFIDIPGLAKDLTMRELAHLLETKEITAEDFEYNVIEPPKPKNEYANIERFPKMERQPTRRRREIRVSGIYIADMIKEYCMDNFIVHPTTAVSTYDDKRDGMAYVTLYCTTGEWKRIMNHYKLKRCNKGYVRPMFDLGIGDDEIINDYLAPRSRQKHFPL